MALSNSSLASNLCAEVYIFSYCCGTAKNKIIQPELWQHVSVILMLLISIILNLIITIIVCRNKRLYTVSNVFAVSLALSDICLATVANINNIFFGFHEVTEDAHAINLQHVFIFFVSFTLICNHLNHLMTSIERWLYIARPFLHQRVVTTKTIAAAVVLVWVLPLISSANLLHDICGFQTNWIRVQINVVFSIFHFVLSFAQLFIYGHIAVITRRQTRRIRQLKATESQGETKDLEAMLANIRATWKQIKMFVIVFGCYFVLMTPWVITNVLAFADNSVGAYDARLFSIAIAFALLQSYGNFITHIMLDKDFKLVLKQCCGEIRCCLCGTKVEPFSAHC